MRFSLNSGWHHLPHQASANFSKLERKHKSARLVAPYVGWHLEFWCFEIKKDFGNNGGVAYFPLRNLNLANSSTKKELFDCDNFRNFDTNTLKQ